jgi:DNA invertase Pin-like site-specific DNA recombinase
MAGIKFVSYLRVSTDKQGASGLGLEAQREAVARFLNGGALVAEYVETESGKKSDRPNLRAALDHAKVIGATLVIAKLDRLARNLHFVSGLMESGVDFIAADNPHANRLTIHILAAVAEDEAKRISERTKAALAAAKARGVKLGNPNGARAMRGKATGNGEAVAAVKAKAQRRAEERRATVAEIKASGISSATAIAKALNVRGVLTPRGGLWHAASVQRLLARLN